MPVTTATINLDISSYLNNLKNISAQTTATIQQISNQSKVKLDVDASGAKSTVNELANTFTSVSATTKQFGADIKNALALMIVDGKQGTAEFKKLQTELVELTAQTKKYDDALKQVDKSTDAVSTGSKSKFSGLKSSLTDIAGSFGGIGSIVAGGGLVAGAGIAIGAIKSIATAGIEFQATLADMSAITGVTGADLDKFGESAKQLSNKFGGTASEQVGVFKGVLSKLSPELAKTPDSLNSITDSINILSKASGISATDAMTAVTSTINQFGLATLPANELAKQTTDIINIMGAGAKEGSAEIKDIADAMAVAGGSAKMANVSILETNSAIQTLAIGELKGAEAGTALRNIFMKLQDGGKEQDEVLKGLGTSYQELGTTLTTKGLGSAFALLKDKMSGLGSDLERNVILGKLFGAENVRGAGTLVLNADRMQDFTNKLKGTNTAYEQAGVNMDTFKEKIARGSAFIQNLGLSVFDAVVKFSTPIVNFLSTLVEYYGAYLKGFFTVIWNSIKPVFTAISDLVDAFMNLFKQFDSGKDKGEGLKKALELIGNIAGTSLAISIKILTIPFRILVALITGAVNIVTDLVKWFKSLGSGLDASAKSGNGFAQTLQNITGFVVNAVKELGGLVQLVLQFLGLLDKPAQVAPLAKPTASGGTTPAKDDTVAPLPDVVRVTSPDEYAKMQEAQKKKAKEKADAIAKKNKDDLDAYIRKTTDANNDYINNADIKKNKDIVNNLEQQKKQIQDIENIKESERAKLLLQKELEINDAKTDLALAQNALKYKDIADKEISEYEKLGKKTENATKLHEQRLKQIKLDAESETSNILQNYADTAGEKAFDAEIKINEKLKAETIAVLDARIALIKGNNDKELALKLELEKKKLEIEYSDVVGTTDVLDAIKLARQNEFNTKILALDKEYSDKKLEIWKKENDSIETIEQIGADIKDIFAKKADERTKQESEQKLKSLETDKENLEKSLLNNEITYDDYAKKLTDIEKQKADTLKEIEKDKTDYTLKLNESLTAGLAVLQKKQNANLDKSVDKWLQSADKGGKALSELGESAGASAIVGFATLLSQGVPLFQAFKQSILVTAIDLAEKLVMSYIPVIFAFISGQIPPPYGQIVAGGVILAGLTLLETAKSALAGASDGYMQGVQGFGAGKGANDNRLIWFDDKETIMNRDETASERGLLTAIKKGKSSREYFNQVYLPEFLSKHNIETASGNILKMNNNRNQKINIFSGSDASESSGASGSGSRNINVTTKSAVEIDMLPLRAKGTDFVTVINKIRQKEINRF